jgi:hypothetical protein
MEPLRVRASNSDGEPVPDAAVRWSATDAEAILNPAQSPTEADGEAESRFTAGPILGEILVSATLEGLPPTTFTVTALDPCQWTKRGQLMTPITGVLGPLDCVDDGLFWDLYSFTLTSQQAVTIQTSSSQFDTRSWLLTFNGIRLSGRAGTIDSLESQHRAVTKAILAPGDYWAGASSFRAGTSGPYLLQLATTSPQAQACGEEVWVARDLITEQQLAATDCVDTTGRFSEDEFSLILWAGEDVRITQSASQFRPRLRLLRRSGDVLVEVDGSSNGTATIDFTADLTRGEYVIVASSTLAQHSGAYTLAISSPNEAAAETAAHARGPESPAEILTSDSKGLRGPLPEWSR